VSALIPVRIQRVPVSQGGHHNLSNSTNLFIEVAGIGCSGKTKKNFNVLTLGILILIFLFNIA
jgi:hypothetical protein